MAGQTGGKMVVDTEHDKHVWVCVGVCVGVWEWGGVRLMYQMVVDTEHDKHVCLCV